LKKSSVQILLDYVMDYRMIEKFLFVKK